MILVLGDDGSGHQKYTCGYPKKSEGISVHRLVLSLFRKRDGIEPDCGVKRTRTEPGAKVSRQSLEPIPKRKRQVSETNPKRKRQVSGTEP